jgi:hypothetical protein
MLLKSVQKFVKSRRLRRGIAIFLLAFAFFDMAIVDVFFPQLCGDEQMSVSVNGPITTSEKITDEVAMTSGRESQSQQNSSPESVDEDCFCCCSHIIPSIYVNLAGLNAAPRQQDQATASLPSSPPLDTYHPPRHS